jgi:hypothetical protein
LTDSASGGNATFNAQGGTVANGSGTAVDFTGYSFTGLLTTAGNATYLLYGGQAPGATGGFTSLSDACTGGQARFVAYGGENGGDGGIIVMQNTCDGGQAQIEVYGNGRYDISFHFAPGLTIGSLAGDGLVYLGSQSLTIGSNDLDTTFLGVIDEDGGIVTGKNGKVTKVG